MDQLQLNKFLEDMTYEAKYYFLEEAKDKEDLTRIAQKRGIKLPAHDLACFKCVYAFVDRMNKNGCTLPREEVEKALATLVGKAIDFDHFRKRVVGYWIDGAVEGNQIVAWGIFFKGNFKEDFDTIQSLLNDNKLAISFEAWGNKIPTAGSKGYSLTDIEFAGGALLLKESPAFPGANVLELANQRVLEFAKVMTKPESFLHTGQKPSWDFEINDELIDKVAKDIGIDFAKIDREQFKMGLEVEKEHGTKIIEACNVTNDNPTKAGRIALVHIMEVSDYYDKLYEYVEVEESGRKFKRPIVKKMKEVQTYRPSLTDDWRKGCIEEACSMVGLMNDVDCSVCHAKGGYNLISLDYKTNSGQIQCSKCGTVMTVSFTQNDKGKSIKTIQTLAATEMLEDITRYVNDYKGSDEELEMKLSIEIEGTDFEEAKFLKCAQCANIFHLHGNTMTCPKCGAKWQKPNFPEIRPEERTDSPYSLQNMNPPNPQLAKKLSYEERQNIKDEMFAVAVNSKNKITGEPRKIRMFPIHDPAHVRNALARLPQATETLKKLGISVESVKNKIIKRARELKMEELMKTHNAKTIEELIQAMAKAAGAKVELGAEAVAVVKKQIEEALVQDTKAQTDLSPKISEFLKPHVTPLVDYKKPEKDAQEPSLNTEKIDDPKAPKATAPGLNIEAPYSKEYEKLQNDLKEAVGKLEAATSELKKFKDAEAAAVKAKTDEMIKARKEELGDFAKDMKDEDVLDETKYEMAKLRKENAELKKGKAPAPKPDLSKGSADKEPKATETKSRSKVDELAFGRDGKAIAEEIKKIG
jgi:hypothetical protein